MACFVAGNPIPRVPLKDRPKAKEVETLKDKLDQDIRVGSYIAYGHALGRCAAIKIGRVLKLTSKPDDPITCSSSPHRLTVVGIEDDLVWIGRDKYPPKLSKIGTLLYPDRVLVLNPSMLTPEYKALLDAFEWTEKPKH
jgi:hypothetical protein